MKKTRTQYRQYNVRIACKLGLKEAIVFNHLASWITFNQDSDSNYYDGRYWTFNSIKKWAEGLPELSYKQVRDALDNLIENGYLLAGNYNKLPYDKTKWYALTDKGMKAYGYEDIEPTHEDVLEAETVNEISFEEPNKIIATVENNEVYSHAQQVLNQIETFYPHNGKWDANKPRERSQFVTRYWTKIVNYAKNNEKIPLENIEQWFINNVKNYVESKTVSREAQYIKKFTNWIKDEDYAIDWNTQNAIQQIADSTPLTNQEKSSIRTAVNLASQPEDYDPFAPYQNVDSTPQIEQATNYDYDVSQDEIEAAWDYASTIE